jgi:hypothetical protein
LFKTWLKHPKLSLRKTRTLNQVTEAMISRMLMTSSWRKKWSAKMKLRKPKKQQY